jgi:hypothetical protein
LFGASTSAEDHKKTAALVSENGEFVMHSSIPVIGVCTASALRLPCFKPVQELQEPVRFEYRYVAVRALMRVIGILPDDVVSL